jgi:hypothetical protein
MINIFVTYRCNLACAYCFARELVHDHPEDMQPETFHRLLAWMQTASVPTAAFIGGEPTLHPGLADMIDGTRNAGIEVVLFTNGLFDGKLADRLAGRVGNFVVNYSDPAGYTPSQRKRLEATLSRLSERGARITFSKNFSSDCLATGELLDAAGRYGVRAIRYDISRPGPSAANTFFSFEQTRGILSHIVAFVRECEARGIRTGLDCCLKWCDLPAEDRQYLQRVSMKLTGICHPSVDIHPDLSASYCLPLYDVRVPDVTAFGDRLRLMAHFSQMVREMRFAEAGEACAACPDFKRTCQGGCMAVKRLSAEPSLVSAA